MLAEPAFDLSWGAWCAGRFERGGKLKSIKKWKKGEKEGPVHGSCCG